MIWWNWKDLCGGTGCSQGCITNWSKQVTAPRVPGTQICWLLVTSFYSPDDSSVKNGRRCDNVGRCSICSVQRPQNTALFIPLYPWTKNPLTSGFCQNKSPQAFLNIKLLSWNVCRIVLWKMQWLINRNRYQYRLNCERYPTPVHDFSLWFPLQFWLLWQQKKVLIIHSHILKYSHLLIGHFWGH